MNIRYIHTDETPELEDWSKKMTEFFCEQSKFTLVIDTGECKTFSDTRKVIGLKVLFDTYKPLTKLYLERTEIIVRDKHVRNTIKALIPLFNSKNPVLVRKC
jgi:hypothetical protein